MLWLWQNHRAISSGDGTGPGQGRSVADVDDGGLQPDAVKHVGRIASAVGVRGRGNQQIKRWHTRFCIELTRVVTTRGSRGGNQGMPRGGMHPVGGYFNSLLVTAFACWAGLNPP